MAKEVAGLIKLQIPGGKANPSPPVGPALGAKGVNIIRYLPILSELYQQKRFDVFPKITADLVENTFTAVTNLVEAITYNPENMEKTLQGNWNFNIGGFNLPCINICLNWGSGSYGCNCS